MSRGDAVTQIRRTGRGEVRRLSPIRPDKVTFKYTSEGEPFFEINGGSSRYTLSSEDAVHLAYRPDFLAADNGGVRGVSPITRHPEAIALAIATERFAATFFRNGARPSMAIEMPGKFPNEDTARRIRARLEAAYSGLDNSFKIAVLELGMKLKELSYKNSDSQLIEIRKEQALEMCRIFGVPPHKIGILDKATFSNIEHQAIEYVTGPLSAFATSHEQALWLTTLSEKEQGEYYIAYDLNGLLRGDIASRYKAYATGRQWGWLSADEVREWEDMDPLPNEAGRSYFVPFNMQQVGGESSDEGPEEPDEEDEPDEPKESSLILGPDGLPARRS
jgi:HK97 family phage portal protein